MAGCPKCHKPLADGMAECPFCGVVVARWREAQEAAGPPPGGGAAPWAPPPPSPPVLPTPGRGAIVPTWVLAALAAVAVLGVAGVLAALYLFVPEGSTAGRLLRTGPLGGPDLAVERVAGGDFDRTVTLPAGPVGLAVGQGQWLLCSRDDPWGFLRLRWGGPDRLAVERVPVKEPVYSQTIGFSAVAWNGEAFIGYTEATWFQEPSGDVFTVHDPESLQVLRHLPAPPLLGALAWDGEGYWAATRKNTQEAPEEAYLYRLGADLSVQERFEPPAVGCQGLAWDGEALWFADVFTRSLYRLDVSSIPPQVTASLPLEVSYLSGVAASGQDLWVCEYGSNTLRRLGRDLLARAGAAPPPGLPPGEALPRDTATPQEVAQLRAALRSGDDQERTRAEWALERLGLPRDYAHERALAPGRAPDDCEVVDFALELREGELFGRWTTWFGEALFAPPAQGREGAPPLPLFARYTVRVEGEGLREPVEREFDAAPGEVATDWTSLAPGLPPGRYRGSLFLHVQYLSADGTPRILNRNSFDLEVGY